jgi:uncharacterized repeat protein (TIGR02543 family)
LEFEPKIHAEIRSTTGEILKTGWVWTGWTSEETQASVTDCNHAAQLKTSFNMKRNGQIMWDDWQKMSARTGFAGIIRAEDVFWGDQNRDGKSILNMKRKEHECT